MNVQFPTEVNLDAGIRVLRGNTLLIWAYNPQDPKKRYVVELLGDSESLGLYKTETFVRHLYEQHNGDGCYGHYLALDNINDISLLELVLVNEGRVLASLGLDQHHPDDAAELVSFGRVMWRGGLRLSGHLNSYRPMNDRQPLLLAFEGSTPVSIETAFLPKMDDAIFGIQFDIMLPLGSPTEKSIAFA